MSKILEKKDFRIEASWDGYMLMYKDQAVVGEGSMTNPRTEEQAERCREQGVMKLASILTGHITPEIQKRLTEINDLLTKIKIVKP